MCVRLFKFQPDYDDIDDDTSRLKPFPSSRSKNKSKDNKKYGKIFIFILVEIICNAVKR